MKFNDKDLAEVAFKPADKEGRLSYKPPSHNSYRERWFKLKGNLLFYFRTNEFGAIADTEPAGLYILERCVAKLHSTKESPYQFSIAFEGDLSNKTLFKCNSAVQCQNWIGSIKKSSYEQMQGELSMLRKKIECLSGLDPLRSIYEPASTSSHNKVTSQDAISKEKRPGLPRFYM
ncbi:PREDICTED: pleckstrin homology domain-containing family J member 1-like [Priapulus caudatus]|uniref:Pleckstrin homology domain-containing family J member 1 n=1 Tax=Priapulus caudatus TaxID=37621 RepID=A0ABM1EE10_PRICU|nr:PREDICTED: pleckstrin homology domain-containing family J member 1-like [Priapulus caudatus]